MQDITPYSAITPLEIAGPIANNAAQQGLLEEYHRTLTPQTIRRQKADIDLFRRYLASADIPSGDFLYSIDTWRGMTWGIVKGFREWMLHEGYAMGSVNVRLSTIKKYAHVAFESGVIDEEAIQRIQSVKGFHGKTARNVDEKRETMRIGAKKAEPTNISSSHMKALKALLEHDTSYTGIRDYLLVCLLGYQGLRCGEVTELKVSDIHLAEGLIVFYRRKVDKTQLQAMHVTTLIAMTRYIEDVQPSGLLLFEGIDREAWTDSTGKYHAAHKAENGLSTRSINDRIRYLGELVGVERLSPHDLRHYWTSDAFKHKTPIDIVMQAGGWNTYEMPLRYRGQTAIANEGIIQSE